ncbi:MAG TPA: glycosyltransferase [Acetobacteraceae bacterium]|nr:glycosyltransferase [Acetobacteraceae bacterium]
MAGAPSGGAELFFERLSIALARAGDAVLPVIRNDAPRAARLAAAGLAPVQLGFGGPLDFMTRRRLATELRRFAPHIAIAWMSRAARFLCRGDWVTAGRLGGYYDIAYFRRCDHLIANTVGLVSWITRQGWPAARVHHLPNFVPDMAGAAPATDAAGEGRLVLALGRLHRNKGFDLLIRALPSLPDARLLIAGEGPERPALEAIARQEGVAARVMLPGWRHDTAALLAACDVFVCPSRQEPLGNAVIEAWSAGRPVVAAAAEGPRELLRPDEDGLLVAVENPPALAQAIGTLLADARLAARLAAAGRLRWQAEFAERPVVAAWRDLLQRLVRR